ncbi:MAG: alcohol dehydrogenase catalytic domain-containing protein [Planctomycetota bacterium]|jgi:threonine dehydrogenase-like Zn-dependent dehydrogenase
MAHIPKTQCALQLTGPDKLVLNRCKEVAEPGPRQILCRVEGVGLCFSDLKLLKQFSGHVRKGDIVSGIDHAVLGEIASYVPGDTPTVPGHEAVVRIEAVGVDVQRFEIGGRYLVQTDYRWLPTAGSNAAFGYNFEGALQEYVLMDERVITSPEGESLLIPVSDELSASAVALVEPFACVEDAYACKERRTLRADGNMLVAADTAPRGDALIELFARYGRPRQITWLSEHAPPEGLKLKNAADISQLEDAGYDDVVYFGSDADKVERLFAKVAVRGLFNIVLSGGKLARKVVTPVGRVHYEGLRIIGTAGIKPADSMERIPQTGEMRCGDTVLVVGAGGPMGVMHVIRSICQGIDGISVLATDVDEARLAILKRIAEPLAHSNSVEFQAYNPARDTIAESFDYTVVMVPIPALVTEAVSRAADSGIINIFAGIPVSVSAQLDLDAYIDKQLYFIGTSGSVLDDMKRVLARVESGRLNTNVCVGAVSGLDGAVEGMRAVENRLIGGKIIVYPACKGLGFVPLEKLSAELAPVEALMPEGLWNKRAEEKLLQIHGGSQA